MRAGWVWSAGILAIASALGCRAEGQDRALGEERSTRDGTPSAGAPKDLDGPPRAGQPKGPVEPGTPPPPPMESRGDAFPRSAGTALEDAGASGRDGQDAGPSSPFLQLPGDRREGREPTPGTTDRDRP